MSLDDYYGFNIVPKPPCTLVTVVCWQCGERKNFETESQVGEEERFGLEMITEWADEHRCRTA